MNQELKVLNNLRKAMGDSGRGLDWCEPRIEGIIQFEKMGVRVDIKQELKVLYYQ